jgi:hypothetical protein
MALVTLIGSAAFFLFTLIYIYEAWYHPEDDISALS